MKNVRISTRKAIIVASLICLVFGFASWLVSRSPCEFEVVSVTQKPGENMGVKFKFTNRSDEPMKIVLVESGIQSISYIPSMQRIPNHQPMRAFGFSGHIRYEEKEVLPGESLIILDVEGVRKSGQAFYAMWQPPPPSDWFSKLRRKLDYKLFGAYPISVSLSSSASKTWKQKLRKLISPDPPRSLISKKFVVP